MLPVPSIEITCLFSINRQYLNKSITKSYPRRNYTGVETPAHSGETNKYTRGRNYRCGNTWHVPKYKQTNKKTQWHWTTWTRPEINNAAADRISSKHDIKNGRTIKVYAYQKIFTSPEDCPWLRSARSIWKIYRWRDFYHGGGDQDDRLFLLSPQGLVSRQGFIESIRIVR